jgi:hypothetical protein
MCTRALNKYVPYCCGLRRRLCSSPLDLVADIQVEGNVVPALHQALAAARKHYYLGSNQVWILHNIPGAADDL